MLEVYQDQSVPVVLERFVPVPTQLDWMDPIVPRWLGLRAEAISPPAYLVRSPDVQAVPDWYAVQHNVSL